MPLQGEALSHLRIQIVRTVITSFVHGIAREDRVRSISCSPICTTVNEHGIGAPLRFAELMGRIQFTWPLSFLPIVVRHTDLRLQHKWELQLNIALRFEFDHPVSALSQSRDRTMAAKRFARMN